MLNGRGMYLSERGHCPGKMATPGSTTMPFPSLKETKRQTLEGGPRKQLRAAWTIPILSKCYWTGFTHMPLLPQAPPGPLAVSRKFLGCGPLGGRARGVPPKLARFWPREPKRPGLRQCHLGACPGVQRNFAKVIGHYCGDVPEMVLDEGLSADRVRIRGVVPWSTHPLLWPSHICPLYRSLVAHVQDVGGSDT